MVGENNLLGIDYPGEARRLAIIKGGVVDTQVHLMGPESASVYWQAARMFGVTSAWTLTPLGQVESVQEASDGRAVTIAVHKRPLAGEEEKRLTCEFLDLLKPYYRLGARIAKFYCAPHIFANSKLPYRQSPLRLDSPERLCVMEAAAELGMGFMLHVADPDIYFRGKY